MQKNMNDMSHLEQDEYYYELGKQLLVAKRSQCCRIVNEVNSHTKSIEEWVEYCVETYCSDTPLPNPVEYKKMTKMQLNVAMLRPVPKIQS